MSKPPSLQHVAKAAGLSPATVSRYLNGSLVLPKETAARIDAAIAALNYRPNPHARSLSRGKSDTIGLVIPDIANPFFARLAAAVEKYADAAGIALMLCSTLNRPERELDYVERLRRNYVDGLLFTTNHQDENGALAAAINASANIVVMDGMSTMRSCRKCFPTISRAAPWRPGISLRWGTVPWPISVGRPIS
jgi:LacI family transcriptional regulator